MFATKLMQKKNTFKIKRKETNKLLWKSMLKIDFKSIITGHDKDAIIEACLTGEEAALNTFKEAVKSDSLSPHLFAIISSQLMMIEKAMAKIKAYKNITV